MPDGHEDKVQSVLETARSKAYPVFCSSVCVDCNKWMRKSSEKWGRPGIVHHVSAWRQVDARWTWGGCDG